MAARCLLYYITDRSQFGGDESARWRSLLAKVAEAADAGVDYIQLREKDLTARKLEALAVEVVAAVRERSTSTRILINSRIDVALAAGAGGVHLRGDDIAAHDVRRVLEASVHHSSAHQQATSDRFLIAASCHTSGEILRAEAEGVDFAVFAPVFGKEGITSAAAAGVDALREACRARIPVFALGGVKIENAGLCLDAGAAGIAGIRLFQQNKVEGVVRAVRAL
jgi:thiamine-phosphate pyrophosphorylase